MNTMVIASDTSGRAVWLDMGWPASDERLVAASEAGAFGIDCARNYLTEMPANTKLRDRNPGVELERRGGVRA
jgi:hypothetical protein